MGASVSLVAAGGALADDSWLSAFDVDALDASSDVTADERGSVDGTELVDPVDEETGAVVCVGVSGVVVGDDGVEVGAGPVGSALDDGVTVGAANVVVVVVVVVVVGAVPFASVVGEQLTPPIPSPTRQRSLRSQRRIR